MNSEHEQKLKAMAYEQAQMQGQCGMPKRLTLRGRVSQRLDDAHRAARKADRLEELQMLLAKHPDVARILDLMEEM